MSLKEVGPSVFDAQMLAHIDICLPFFSRGAAVYPISWIQDPHRRFWISHPGSRIMDPGFWSWDLGLSKIQDLESWSKIQSRIFLPGPRTTGPGSCIWNAASWIHGPRFRSLSFRCTIMEAHVVTDFWFRLLNNKQITDSQRSNNQQVTNKSNK